ncbi:MULTISPECIES: serine hydrolase domain-containing protein [unclassified Microcoleus]|uniref:serine hydrolase domain-containing protein n=1 Tax=unclassified Microcoleus TaxID=2642155 RepID=UPI002FD1475D
MDRITQDYLSKREKLALTIGVVEQGHHYIKGFGKLSDTVSAIPNAGTIYEIASVTKLFTRTVLAKLVNDGTVDLHAPIRLYLPLEVINQLNPAVQSITLQQLATHTSGLPRLLESFLEEIQYPSNPYLHYTAQEMYADIAEITLLSEPGQSYEYSNFGMGWLGRDRLLKPLL